MTKDYRLCPHVLLRIHKQEKIVEVIQGPVYSYFGWSVKEQADTPRIRCSDCRKHIQILGYIVKRDPTATYVPPTKELARGKKPTRKSSSKKDKGDAGLTWSFSD